MLPPLVDISSTRWLLCSMTRSRPQLLEVRCAKFYFPVHIFALSSIKSLSLLSTPGNNWFKEKLVDPGSNLRSCVRPWEQSVLAQVPGLDKGRIGVLRVKMLEKFSDGTIFTLAGIISLLDAGINENQCHDKIRAGNPRFQNSCAPYNATPLPYKLFKHCAQYDDSTVPKIKQIRHLSRSQKCVNLRWGNCTHHIPKIV